MIVTMVRERPREREREKRERERERSDLFAVFTFIIFSNIMIFLKANRCLFSLCRGPDFGAVLRG